jgi:maltose alpha-D-glucosyltransferase/alpha-amylase
MVLKMLRRIESGTHPELDANRFLSEVGFKNTPAFLGSVEWIQPGGGVWGLALLQAWVQNQGDGWTWTLDHLRRVLDEAQLTSLGSATVVDPHGIYGALIATLGQRVAEMHRAFATPVQDPAFTPEPVTAADLQRWAEDARQQGRAARAALENCRDALAGGLKSEAERLLAGWEEVDQRIVSLAPVQTEFLKTRLHGDLHLSQVLLCKDDFVIIDFEGDPVRSLADRSAKSCILKDVAEMLGSFDSAAAAALSERLDLQPQHRSDMERAAEEWRQLAYTRFLDAYRANAEGLVSYPQSEIADRLLNLFLLKRVLYNIASEASSRPGWIHVHLSALLRLLGRMA